MPEDIEERPVAPAPNEFAEEIAQEQEEAGGGNSGWEWIGDNRRPEAQASKDGISDLFEVSDEDIGGGEEIDDLVEVDMERDIIDAGEDGTLDDLVNVTNEDIMGSGEHAQPPPKGARLVKRRVSRQSTSPPNMGGLRQ